MASKYSIEAVFKLLDNFSAPLDKIGKRTTSFSQGFQKDVAKAEIKWKQLGRTITTVGKMAAGAGIAAVTAGLVDSTKKYIEFEDVITKTGSKFVDLDVTSADYADRLEQLQAASRKVGAVTKYSASDAAGALDKMAMAGIASDKAISMLMGTTNLAVAAGTDLTTAVDIATDALGIYGKALGSKGLTTAEEQLNKISDVMAKTGVMANTDLSGLFEAMTYAGPSFVSASQDVETLSAAIGTLSNAGVKGSAAGTALNAVFTQLGKADKVSRLAELGVEVKDAEGNFRNLFDIVGDVEKATANMGDVEKKGFLNSIFDTRGEKAINLLMTAGVDSLRAFEKELQNSGGTADKIARAQEKSLKGQIAVLSSVIQDKQLSFGKASAEGGGSKGLQNLIQMIQNWDPAPVINFMIAVMDKLPAIINFVTGLVSILWKFKGVIAVIIGVFAAYKAVVMATAAQQLILYAVWAANPVGLLVAAIAGLIGLVALLVMHWDDVLAVLQKVGAAVLSVSEKFGVFLGPMGMALSVVSSFVKNLDMIKQAFTDGGIQEGIFAIGKAILSGLIAPIQNLLIMLSKIPGIGKIAGAGAEALTSLQEGLTGREAATEPVAPVTAGERVAYSREETRNTVDMNISLDKGLKSSVTGTAPNININRVSSSAF